MSDASLNELSSSVRTTECLSVLKNVDVLVCCPVAYINYSTVMFTSMEALL